MIRITLNGYKLSTELGIQHNLDTSKIRRVLKGYGLRPQTGSSFVRLRFNTSAKKAMKGIRITNGELGTEILFPFGEPLVPSAVLPEISKPIELDLAEASPEKSAPKPDELTEEGAFTDEEKESLLEILDSPTAEQTDLEAEDKNQKSPAKASAEEPRPPESEAPEFKEADMGLTLLKVIGSMALLTLILVGLLVVYKKITGFRASRFAKVGRSTNDLIEVISTSFIGDKHKIALVDIMGKTLVLGLSDSEVNTLAILEKEEIDSFRKAAHDKRHLIGDSDTEANFFEDEHENFFGRFVGALKTNVEKVTPPKVTTPKVTTSKVSLTDKPPKVERRTTPDKVSVSHHDRLSSLGAEEIHAQNRYEPIPKIQESLEDEDEYSAIAKAIHDRVKAIERV